MGRQLGDVQGFLFVASQRGIVLRAEQHYVIAAMIRDDYGFTERERTISAELPLKLG